MTNPGQNETTDYQDKLDGIATDPNLSVEEKLDEIDAALADLDSIGTDAATAPAGSDVIGDPESATYSSAPSEPASDSSATVESADTVESTPAPAAGAAIGVAGVVDYSSSRDVDGDGLVDLTHSRVDGVDTITHYDEDGGITLVEQDTDYNGTYESAVSARPDGTFRLAEDRDDDGDVDLATYRDPATGQNVRQDVIDDGRITDSQFDTDGDGEPDTLLVDTDGDGRFDTAVLDTDADGITNETLVDTDGDGRFDLLTVDTDNDGTQESFITSNMTDDGTLGDIAEFEALIPDEDSYHAQAGTDPYEAPTVDEVPSDIV